MHPNPNIPIAPPKLIPAWLSSWWPRWILREKISVSSIGHAYRGGVYEYGGLNVARILAVEDYLVDQSQSTGGGGMMQDPLQLDLTTGSRYVYEICAPPNKKFSVSIPDSPTCVCGLIQMQIGRKQIPFTSSSHSVSYYDSNLAFDGIVGSLPSIFTTTHEFWLTEDNAVFSFDISLGMSTSGLPSFQFSKLSIWGDYVAGPIDPGLKSYEPYGALGTSAQFRAFVRFVYLTLDRSVLADPGPFVTIV